MLHINRLTYRIEGRTLLEHATAGIPAGHKVGIVGRNGTGKTTLLKLISGELHPDEGEIKMPNNMCIGYVDQEVPGGPENLIDTVLAADLVRAELLEEAQQTADPHRIAEIQLRLTDIDAYTAPARAASILAGLGFDEEAHQRPCSDYSGGWRMRVALAAVLLVEPDLLLLDEPNNYLDLEGSLWLENYLKSYHHTVLIVSHDRDLLNNSVSSILNLRNKRLTLYSGGYDTFEETRREQQRLELKLKKKQDDQRRHMQAFVERFRAKATKARQAQSRLKALAKLQPIVAQIDERVAPFYFANPEKPLSNPLMQLEAASVGYDGQEPVLQNLDLRIDIDDRIGLLGTNGNGKSTFAKLLAGRLSPLSGGHKYSKKLRIGYFSQHQLDELNPQKSPYGHIAELMEEATEAQKRGKTGQFGFGIDKADTPSGQLSGGEKARLLLALVTFHKPHLLILDEPTNHLDVDSCEALIHALNDYEGAVILISHDRHLIEASVDRLWLVNDGTVTVYDGDLQSYRAQRLELSEKHSRKETPHKAAKKSIGKQEERRLAAARRAKLAPLKKALVRHEKRVHELASELAALDKKLGDNSLYEKEPDTANELVRERGKLAKSLEDAEAEWLAATEAFEVAQNAVTDL